MLKPFTRNGISSNINKKIQRDEVSSSISSSQHPGSKSPAQHKTQSSKKTPKVTPRGCLMLVVDVPIFQRDWCGIVMEFSSDILFCLIFPSSGIVFPVKSSFQQCLKTDAFCILAYNNPVCSCTVKFSVCSWVILS